MVRAGDHDAAASAGIRARRSNVPCVATFTMTIVIPMATRCDACGLETGGGRCVRTGCPEGGDLDGATPAELALSDAYDAHAARLFGDPIAAYFARHDEIPLASLDAETIELVLALLGEEDAANDNATATEVDCA